MELTRYARKKALDSYDAAWASVERTLLELWPGATVARSPIFVNALQVSLWQNAKGGELATLTVALADVPISPPFKSGHRWRWPGVDPEEMVKTVEALTGQLPPPSFSMSYQYTEAAAGLTKQINDLLFR